MSRGHWLAGLSYVNSTILINFKKSIKFLEQSQKLLKEKKNIFSNKCKIQNFPTLKEYYMYRCKWTNILKL